MNPARIESNDPGSIPPPGKMGVAHSSAWKAWMLPIFVCTCWLLAIRHLAPDWSLNEQYHYGWLVPLLALYLAKVRFERCPAQASAPSPCRARWLLLAVAFASVLSMPLREANVQWRSMGWWLTTLAVIATLLGFWQTGGFRWVKHFVFPILFFYTAVPLWRGMEDHGMHWLMQHNAQLSVEILHWVGVEVQARGNLIALPSGTLGVDEACSGIRSLQGTLMLTLFLGEILALTWRRRVILLVAGFLWALFTNVARTSTLGWIASRKGLEAMEASHDTAGYTVLAICSALVALTAWLLYRRMPTAGTPAAPVLIDTASIARRFSSLSTPAIVGLAILSTGMLATESWFRLHERSEIPLTPWRFRLPVEKPDFQRTEIAPRIRADLRFNEGYGGKWTDSGLRWQALYFRWLPGRNAAQTVGVHDPRACLAAAGMKEISVLPPLPISLGDVSFLVDAYHFLDGTQDVYVYNCLAEDVRRGEAQTRIREDNSISSRFVATLAGKRHRGQRRLEVAIWGGLDASAAEKAFRQLLATQIQAGERPR